MDLILNTGITGGKKNLFKDTHVGISPQLVSLSALFAHMYSFCHLLHVLIDC